MSLSGAGTTTLLFTDIEGSTKLLNRLGDGYAGVLADHHRLLRQAFAEHGGTELDTAGDGLFYKFGSARAAVAAAIDAQRALRDHEWPAGETVRVRMGLHTGEPVASDLGLIGIDVHRAARICDAGHGGQILLSRTARDLAGRELPAGVSLVDLGEHRLKSLVDIEHLFEVQAEGLAANFPPLRTLHDLPTNLPRRLSSFVGREQQVADARELLRKTPLVTLVGPGGVGKTSLAIQIASGMLEEFADGIWLVELGAVADDALVLPTIAAALNVVEQPGRSLRATVLDHLRTRRLCLLLDNCEHLLKAAAEVAYAILAATDTRILATSREALGVEGERVFAVQSLDLPEASLPIDPPSAAKFEAIRLFVDRATAAQPAFQLTDQNVATVLGLCHRLDGIPLALELAAARLRALPVEEVAIRLDDRFRLLTGGNRLSVTRHQTLRATIDWSYDLLSPDERAIFRRLSVFAGGFTVDAAETVAAGDGVATTDVLDLLARLVDKSLVLSDSSTAEARFRMLETIRQYARERLVDAGEAEAVHRRHRNWYLGVVERGKPAFFGGPPPADWLAVFDREHDNLRQALEWSAAEAGAAAGLRLADGLWRYWEIRGHLAEGRQWLDRMLTATDGEVSILRSSALTGAGILAHMQGDYTAAVTLHEESLDQQRKVGNEVGVGFALHNLANLIAEQGDYARARDLYEEAMPLAVGDRGAALGLVEMADVVSRQGGYSDAREVFERAVKIFHQFGDRWAMAFALDRQAAAASRSADHDTARRLHAQALSLSRELGDERGVARSIMHLADDAAREGDLTRAKSLHRESLRMRQALHDLPGVATVLERLAWAVMHSAADDAARLLGAAESLREAIKTPLPSGAREEYRRNVEWLSQRLGSVAFDAARAEGRTLDAEAVVRTVFVDEPPPPAPSP